MDFAWISWFLVEKLQFFYQFFLENVNFQPRFANFWKNLGIILGLIYYFWPAPEGFFILDVPNKHPWWFQRYQSSSLVYYERMRGCSLWSETFLDHPTPVACCIWSNFLGHPEISLWQNSKAKLNQNCSYFPLQIVFE